MTLYEDLQWRGLIKDVSSPELEKKLNEGGLTFLYWNRPYSRQFACWTFI